MSTVSKKCEVCGENTTQSIVIAVPDATEHNFCTKCSEDFQAGIHLILGELKPLTEEEIKEKF